MSNPMPLAGWEAPICKCGHSVTSHQYTLGPIGRCVTNGCGCLEFRARDDEQPQEENAA